MKMKKIGRGGGRPKFNYVDQPLQMIILDFKAFKSSGTIHLRKEIWHSGKGFDLNMTSA